MLYQDHEPYLRAEARNRIIARRRQILEAERRTGRNRKRNKKQMENRSRSKNR